MKIKPKPESTTCPEAITIELSALEAHRLTDICGCDITIPETLGQDTKGPAFRLLNELFDSLNALGYRRSLAKWEDE